MTTAIACALLAALLYGASAGIEQHQAATAPDAAAGKPRLIGFLIRQPLWLLGLAVQAAGFAVHAVALRSGPLGVVQMIVAAELIVSVAMVRVRSGRPVPRTVWTAGAAVLAGILVFTALTSAGPAPGPDPGTGGAALGTAVTSAAAVAAAAAGLTASGKRRALLLAVAAGLADASAAVITAALAQVSGHGVAAAAGSWPAWALLIAGPGSVLLTQTAYQAARPLITLPVIAVVTPMTSVAVGAVFLGEASRLGPGRGVAAAITALATGAAIVALARSAPGLRDWSGDGAVLVDDDGAGAGVEAGDQVPAEPAGQRPGIAIERRQHDRGRSSWNFSSTPLGHSIAPPSRPV